VWVAVVLLAAVALSAATPAPPTTQRLLFIGDSLTSCSGVSGDFTTAHLSYRRWLWPLITAALGAGPLAGRCRADVVGPRSGCNKRLDAAMANVTALFPQRHDAFFGRTLRHVLRSARAVAAEYRPDVVVALLGINDLIYGKPAERVTPLYEELAKQLHGGGGVRRLVLVTLPSIDAARFADKPRKLRKHAAAQAGVAELNRFIASDALAAAAARAGVALAVARADRGYDAAAMSYDGVHPNGVGERHIAAAVFAALRPLLCLPPRAAGEPASAAADGGVGVVEPQASEEPPAVSGSGHDAAGPGNSAPLLTAASRAAPADPVPPATVAAALLLCVAVLAVARRRRPLLR
jgi:lysophospholipase L1-like esterase